jgi:hypothetical protein
VQYLCKISIDYLLNDKHLMNKNGKVCQSVFQLYLALIYLYIQQKHHHHHHQQQQQQQQQHYKRFHLYFFYSLNLRYYI